MIISKDRLDFLVGLYPVAEKHGYDIKTGFEQFILVKKVEAEK